MTGRIQPTTLGPSARGVIKSRTGRVKPRREPTAAAIASTGPSAGSPLRRRTDTCLDPQTSRNENRITPRAQAGIANDPSKPSHVGVDATDPFQTAATVCGIVEMNCPLARAGMGLVHATQTVITGNATSATRARQLAIYLAFADRLLITKSAIHKRKATTTPCHTKSRSAVRRACSSAVIFCLLRIDPKVFRWL